MPVASEVEFVEKACWCTGKPGPTSSRQRAPIALSHFLLLATTNQCLAVHSIRRQLNSEQLKKVKALRELERAS
jgi:hypothetical protein